MKIDSEKTIAHLKKRLTETALNNIGYNEDVYLNIADYRITTWVNEVPSAEPEIIRCKDCKHNANPPEAGNADCDLFYGMTEQYGFCHRAERRTDG